MNKVITNKKFVEVLKERFQNEMPRILKEIEVYESHLKMGKLKHSPKMDELLDFPDYLSKLIPEIKGLK